MEVDIREGGSASVEVEGNNPVCDRNGENISIGASGVTDGLNREGVTVSSDKPSDFGKFKSASELLNAYSELEKAFTRKCQELSLAKKSSTITKEKDDGSARDGGSAKGDGSARGDGSAKDDGSAKGGSGAVAGEQRKSAIESGEVLTKSGSVGLDIRGVIEASQDERVQRLVVSRYLQGINKGSVRLMGGKDGGGFAITPPHSPKTVEEAGKIAVRYFNKR